MEVNTASACSTRQDYEMYKIFSGINLFISVSNVATNGLLSHVLWKLKKLNTTSYRFIFVQSICDILVGSAMLITRSASYFNSFAQFCDLKAYADIICDTLCMFSGVMVTLIALDRYIHMRFLNRYSVWMTKRRAILLVILNGSICFVVGGIQILAYLGHWYHLVLLIQNCVAILLIVSTSTVYIYAYKSLSIRTKQIDFGRSAPKNSNGKRRKRNPSKEFLKAMVAILSMFMICFTPFVVSSALKFAYLNKSVKESMAVIIIFYISRILVCMNSSLNAVLYISLNKDLRVYALQIASFGYFEDTSSIIPPVENVPSRIAFSRNSGLV